MSTCPRTCALGGTRGAARRCLANGRSSARRAERGKGNEGTRRSRGHLSRLPQPPHVFSPPRKSTAVEPHKRCDVWTVRSTPRASGPSSGAACAERVEQLREASRPGRNGRLHTGSQPDAAVSGSDRDAHDDGDACPSDAIPQRVTRVARLARARVRLTDRATQLPGRSHARRAPLAQCESTRAEPSRRRRPCR